MTNLAFPSEEFPARPAVTLAVPDDWEPVYSPATVLAARLYAADQGTFLPNVVVRIERRSADFDVPDAISEIREFIGERPQGTMAEPFKVDLNGLKFIGCDLSWVDDKFGTVLQLHLFHGVRSGPFVQVVQITGSVAGAQAHEDYPSLRAIMETLTVGTLEHGDRMP